MDSMMNLAGRMALCTGLLVLGLALPSEASSDKTTIAIAVPVERITVDGDLSDWPEDVVRYPFFDSTAGNPPKGTENVQGSFRVGYNEQENAIYIAIEMPDKSAVASTQLEAGAKPDSLFVAGASEGEETGELVVNGSFEAFEKVHVVKRGNNKQCHEFRYNINQVNRTVLMVSVIHGISLNELPVDDFEGKKDIHVRSEMVLPVGFMMEFAPRGWHPHLWWGYVVLGGNDMTTDKAFALVLKKSKDDISFRTREATTYQMLLAGMAIAFTLVHLLLFLFYPRARANLYYAVFVGAAAAAVFLTFQMEYETNPTGRFLLTKIVESPAFIRVVQLGLPISGLRLLYALYYAHLPTQFWIFVGSLVVLLGLGADENQEASFQLVAGQPTPKFLVVLLLLWVLVYIAEVARVVVWAIVKKKDGAWVLGTGFSALFLAILYGIFGRHMGTSPPVVTQTTAGQLIEAGSILYGAACFFISTSIHLARNVARTSKNLEVQLIQNQELSAKNLEQERALRAEAEKELQTAHEMQMALMPKAPPQIQGFEITGRCIPANHVGGDLFQYFHQHDRLSISLADVTGHAMEAAIPVVMFSGILRSQMEVGGSVEELFHRLNRSLHGTLTGHTLVCLAMGQLDPSTRCFRFSNAGCPYPYHYRAATGEVVELRMDAYPLGVRPDTTYRGAEVQLEPGDRVVFCSDGIAEAANAAGEMFGFERTAETVRRGCAEGLSAEGLLARIIQEVKAFSGEVPQGDDQTVVVLRVEKEDNPG